MKPVVETMDETWNATDRSVAPNPSHVRH